MLWPDMAVQRRQQLQSLQSSEEAMTIAYYHTIRSHLIK